MQGGRWNHDICSCGAVSCSTWCVAGCLCAPCQLTKLHSHVLGERPPQVPSSSFRFFFFFFLFFSFLKKGLFCSSVSACLVWSAVSGASFCAALLGACCRARGAARVGGQLQHHLHCHVLLGLQSRPDGCLAQKPEGRPRLCLHGRKRPQPAPRRPRKELGPLKQTANAKEMEGKGGGGRSNCPFFCFFVGKI